MSGFHNNTNPSRTSEYFNNRMNKGANRQGNDRAESRREKSGLTHTEEANLPARRFGAGRRT